MNPYQKLDVRADRVILSLQSAEGGSVPHDEAEPRISAALAAGGRLVNDAEAPAFWVLADADGNEACVTTWQGRD